MERSGRVAQIERKVLQKIGLQEPEPQQAP